MAFGHVSGIAANAVAFFVVLENFLAGRGWILVAGGGTTSIVYRSTGELGTLTMLYTRIRRTAGTAEIYYRVQDDAAGTHTTTEANLVMPGLGAVPFNYWISGDKNCVIMVIKAGVSYTGCYIGTLEPFALAVTDERYMHTTIDFNSLSARILRRYSGAYDWASTFYGMLATSDPTVLDGSRTLYGGYIRTSNDEIYGQPFYITYNQGGLGFNSQDTITSGYPAATSDWIAFLCGANIICIMTAGILPLGIGESLGYTVQAGIFADAAATYAGIRAFLVGLGWTDAAWYLNPAETRYFTSTGESGVEDIRCRLYFTVGGGWIEFDSVDINGAGYHAAASQVTGMIPANWPLPYYLFGDLDCFGMAILFNGNWTILWAGKVIATYPDETIIPHEYKQGAALLGWAGGGPALSCLRDRNGTWGLTGASCPEFSNVYSSSSPNLIDGVTYVLWPLGAMVDNAAPYWIFGIFKYVYRLSGTALSVGDTVQIGAMTFQYLYTNLVLRIA